LSDIWNSGRKNVTAGVPAEKVLSRMALKPDFSIADGNGKDIKFVHRTLGNGEILWVTNLSKDTRDITASFRTTGKKPVIWHAEDASIEPVSYVFTDSRTNVRMNLTQHQSVFVIFTDDTDVAKAELPQNTSETMAEISAPWSVRFQQGRGAPESATFEKLTSLSESSEAGIKYFSGAVTYSNTFKLKKKDIRSKDSVILDLGEVKDLAEVTVNGKNLGVIWNAPFKVDITKALRNGTNTIEVKVINMWHNRLVGDVQPGVNEKITYTQMEFFKPDEPLLPAGLLGPVKVIGTTINK
ncbi:MAG TPA: glycoside hydrolase, partial [Rikenellaceae bacterium]|nr:glycoside hydrolase [Rikenellaceae bacterium]